ncbi:MAG TPA: hypothetical protein VNG13_06700 [Mycobacteriales bacterium]|nr:hypothetical protein [Mycobacteriales bacterium]
MPVLRALPLALLGETIRITRETTLLLFPHGGQLVARRNAWQAQVADGERAMLWSMAHQAIEAAALPDVAALVGG